MMVGSGLDTVGKGRAPSIFIRVLAMASGLASCPVDSVSSRKSFSSQIMGVELPLPGRSTFHLIFCVAFHFVGGWQPVTVPSALGPRQVGHWLVPLRYGFKKRRLVIIKRKFRMERRQEEILQVVTVSGFRASPAAIPSRDVGISS